MLVQLPVLVEKLRIRCVVLDRLILMRTKRVFQSIQLSIRERGGT